MGCAGSAPAKTEMRRNNTTNAISRLSTTSEFINRPPNECDFEEILKGIYSIVHLDGSSPIVCIGEESFPLVVEDLYSEENEPVNFDIPIVAASKYGEGKVLCFGNSIYFAPKIMHVENTEDLLHNCLRWVSTGKTTPEARGHALVLGFTEESDYIVEFMRRRKMHCTISKKLENLENYRYIFLSLGYSFENPDDYDILMEYVHNGGSLLVFACFDKELNNFENNKALIKAGLSYPRANFVIGNESQRLSISHKFSEVNLARFSYVKENYISMLSADNADVMDLDTSISVLHLYTSSLGKEHQALLRPLYQETLDYLNRNEYITPDGIAPRQLQTLALVQLTSLLITSPLMIEGGCPTIDKFPGVAGKEEKASTFTRKFVLTEGQFGWISTGLWLQAATAAKIKISRPALLKVQFGSHLVELTRREGPYLRWPMIVSEVELLKEENEVSSPFGGLAYLVTDEVEEEEEEIEVTFENFLECPRYIKGHEEVWNSTKDRDVPWGEIESESIVFTLPRAVMLQITNFEEILHVFDVATSVIGDFMRVDIASPIRVVYDIETLSGSVYPKNYNPIYMRLENAKDLMTFTNPSPKLFQLFTKLAMSLISSDNLDRLTKKTLSMIASANAFLALWPKEDPFVYTNKYSKLTQSLWEIHTTVSDKIIPMTIDSLRDLLPEQDGCPDDPWIAFVMLLSKNGGKNFTEILQKSRPIPLNATLSVKQLPAFKDQ